MSTADFKLDAQLRAVPLPGGLLDRLMALPLAGEGAVDEIVRDVAIPPGLLQRLLAIPLTEDDGLDEALRNIPVPDDLMTSCRHHNRRLLARREGRHPMDLALRISRFAIATSLILALTLSVGSALLLVMKGSIGGLTLPLLVKNTPAPPVPEERLETSWRMLADDVSGSGDAQGDFEPTSRAGDFKRDIELADIEPSEEFRDKIASARLPDIADPLMLSSRVLGHPRDWDDLPELPISPTHLVPHGLDWPLEPGSNRPFLQRWGFHPFVSPAAGSRLQTCPVPLAIEPTSYDLTRRYMERNEWPPAARVRTEEFLAAVDYNFPKPKHQSLGLIVAGGPSPISCDGFCLLQVGVQARQTELANHTPAHLVFLVDTSSSMRWGSRMEIVRRALHDLRGVVGAKDRVSLVAFNQAGHVLVENAGEDALPQFSAAADSLSAEGATNIVAGLSEAFGVARQSLGSGRPAVRVVLVTDGLLDLEPAVAQKIQEQAAQAAGQKIPLEVIDLGQQKQSDPQVTALAQSGHGTVHRAESVEQIRWALRELVTGRSQLVARSARLQVTFNPKSVLGDRLIGHESGEWDGLLPGSLETDFREGQTATALFEVRLAPNGPNDLASVDLTWYTADGEKTQAGKTPQKAHTTVDHKQFAQSLITSAPSLQMAAVVAYAAEVLRHSPFIFQHHRDMSMPAALFRAVELCGQVDSQLQLRPSFDEFVSLIRQEMKSASGQTLGERVRAADRSVGQAFQPDGIIRLESLTYD